MPSCPSVLAAVRDFDLGEIPVGLEEAKLIWACSSFSTSGSICSSKSGDGVELQGYGAHSERLTAGPCRPAPQLPCPPDCSHYSDSSTFPAFAIRRLGGQAGSRIQEPQTLFGPLFLSSSQRSYFMLFNV